MAYRGIDVGFWRLCVGSSGLLGGYGKGGGGQEGEEEERGKWV